MGTLELAAEGLRELRLRPRAPGEPLKLGVLVSGTGRSLKNLLDLERRGVLPTRTVLVVSSKAGAGAVAHAVAAGVPCTVLPPKDVARALDAAGADLAVLAGYLKRWPIPPAWLGRAINIHPALLPEFGGPGFYGHHVHAAVLAAGRSRSGCTVHLVTPEYDAGAVLARSEVPVLPGDTPEGLAARVFEAELELLPAVLRALAAAPC